MATQCWTCLKYKIESTTERFVSLRKQGTSPGRNTCQKRLLEKMLTNRCSGGGVYKHTGNVEHYTNYKEALNLATTEIRKSKRTFGQTLKRYIKNNSNSLYAYERSKQKFRDKVRPLENNSGNKISDEFQMNITCMQIT